MENLSKEMDNQEKFVLNDNGDLSVENLENGF